MLHLLLLFGIAGVEEVHPLLGHCHNPKFSYKCHSKPPKDLKINYFPLPK